jgi:hypothetical protein
MKTFVNQGLCLALLLVVPGAAALAEEMSVYYVCPGNVFTNMLSAKEAQSRGCKAREVQQPTTISGPKLRPPLAAGRSSDMRVGAADQKARDSDARRILTDELSKQEDKLAAMRKDYNDGQPERQGDERNYQKYLDRVAEMKASLARQESDVAAIRRELASLPQ